jgi:hypothetical protein
LIVDWPVVVASRAASVVEVEEAAAASEVLAVDEATVASVVLAEVVVCSSARVDWKAVLVAAVVESAARAATKEVSVKPCPGPTPVTSGVQGPTVTG